jgi:hypothetical protein
LRKILAAVAAGLLVFGISITTPPSARADASAGSWSPGYVHLLGLKLGIYEDTGT